METDHCSFTWVASWREVTAANSMWKAPQICPQTLWVRNLARSTQGMMLRFSFSAKHTNPVLSQLSSSLYSCWQPWIDTDELPLSPPQEWQNLEFFTELSVAIRIPMGNCANNDPPSWKPCQVTQISLEQKKKKNIHICRELNLSPWPQRLFLLKLSDWVFCKL